MLPLTPIFHILQLSEARDKMLESAVESESKDEASPPSELDNKTDQVPANVFISDFTSWTLKGVLQMCS